MKRCTTVVLFLAFFSFCSFLRAQIVSVEIGVNGLTCSQCTRSVEMSIRKLDFVKEVQMNLDNTNGIIYFHADKTVSIEKIAQAVFDAGFSVRFLKADFLFAGQQIKNDYCYELAGSNYQFIEVPEKTLNGQVSLHFIGKLFMPKAELKQWKNKTKKNCGEQHHYFVTL